MITQPHPLNTGNSVASIEYSKLIWINRADVVENAYVLTNDRSINWFQVKFKEAKYNHVNILNNPFLVDQINK